ncbi:MAG: hypothetical protein WD689_09055 [Gaiellaceae bacterium]
MASTAFFISSDGSLLIPFSYMGDRPPFGKSRQMRDELRRRIDAVPGAAVPTEEERENLTLRPELLADTHVREAINAAFEWAFEQARQAQHEPAPRSE